MDNDRLNLPSASNMERIANCPGSRALVALCPPQPSTQVSLFGDNVHGALYHDSVDGLTEDETSVALRLQSLEERAVSMFRQEAFTGQDPVIYKEERFWAYNAALEPVVSAQVDRAYWVEPRALVLDFKTGFADTTPSDVNWQLKSQIVCFWHNHRKMTRARVGICASRLTNKLDMADYDLAALKAAERDVMTALRKSEEPGAPRFPGSWCNYCPAKADCREYTAWSTLEVQTLATDDSLAMALAIDRLTPRAMAKIYAKRTAIKNLMESVTHRLKTLPASELAAIGLELEQSGGKRKVVDSADLFERLKKEGFSEEDLRKAMSFGLKAVSQLVGVKFNLKGEPLAQKVAEIAGPSIGKDETAAQLKTLSGKLPG